MKRLVIAIVTMVVIIFASLLFTLKLYNINQECTSTINSILHYSSTDYEKTLLYLDMLEHQFSQNKIYLTFYLNNSSLGQIEKEIQILKGLVELEELEDFYSRCLGVKYDIAKLFDYELPSIENVF